LAWEYAFLNQIQETFSAQWLDAVMVFISFLSNGGMIWIIAAVIMLFIPKYRRFGIILAIVLIFGAILNSLILKPVIGRPRPFEGLENISLLISPPSDASLPSGHTLVSVSSAIVLFAANKKLGTFALILAVLTAFSRMYLYVHFPTDIIAGATLGIAISLLCLGLSHKISRPKS